MDRIGKKALTLVEVLVASAIFSVLSLSLYLLLRSGISIREKIELQQTTLQNTYITCERSSHEVRNAVNFNNDDSGFEGSEKSFKFYTLLFDYACDYPKISHITYSFKDHILEKEVRKPFKENPIRAVPYITNIAKVSFEYFDSQVGAWEMTWEEKNYLPRGVRINLTIQDERGRTTSINKHIFIHQDT